MAITNIVGPVQRISLANHPVKGMYFMPTGCPQVSKGKLPIHWHRLLVAKRKFMFLNNKKIFDNG